MTSAYLGGTTVLYPETTGNVTDGARKADRLSVLPNELIVERIFHELGTHLTLEDMRDLLQADLCEYTGSRGPRRVRPWTTAQRSLAHSNKFLRHKFRQTHAKPIIFPLTDNVLSSFMSVPPESVVTHMEENSDFAAQAIDKSGFNTCPIFGFYNYRLDPAAQRLLSTFLTLRAKYPSICPYLQDTVNFAPPKIMERPMSPPQNFTGLVQSVDWPTLTGGKVRHHLVPAKWETAWLDGLPTTPVLTVHQPIDRGSVRGRSKFEFLHSGVPQFRNSGTTLAQSSKVHAYAETPPRPEWCPTSDVEAVFEAWLSHVNWFGYGLADGLSAPDGEFILRLSDEGKDFPHFQSKLSRNTQGLNEWLATRGARFKITLLDGGELRGDTQAL